MTPAEFIEHSKTFPLGEVAVVSGADITKVTQLLVDAMTAIEGSSSKQVLVFDARDEIVYSQRFYIENAEEARLWEFVALVAEGAFVVLVANEFDRSSLRHSWTVEIDTVLDIIDADRVIDITSSASRHRTGFPRGIRELFPHITRVYHYDTNSEEITFVKTQIPDRP